MPSGAEIASCRTRPPAISAAARSGRLRRLRRDSNRSRSSAPASSSASKSRTAPSPFQARSAAASSTVECSCHPILRTSAAPSRRTGKTTPSSPCIAGSVVGSSRQRSHSSATSAGSPSIHRRPGSPLSRIRSSAKARGTSITGHTLPTACGKPQSRIPSPPVDGTVAEQDAVDDPGVAPIGAIPGGLTTYGTSSRVDSVPRLERPGSDAESRGPSQLEV